MECYRFVWNGNIILSKHNKLCWKIAILSWESIKRIITKCPCDLSCAVRAEIVKNHGVIFFYRRYRFAIFDDHGRFYEFVGFILFIGIFDRAHRTLCCLALAINHGIVCSFYTIPAVITIHNVITSHHGGNLSNTDLFHLCPRFFHKIFSGSRWCVTTV